MKTLLIHASFGEGHKRAAECLKDSLQAPCKDLLEFCPGVLKKIFFTGYLFLTQHMIWLWNLILASGRSQVIGRVVNKLNSLIFFSIFKYIRESKPKVIVTTHFFIAPLLASLKSELNFKLIVILTDTKVYPLWVHPCVDCYFASFTETKNDLINQGVSENKIISGYTSVREGFFKELISSDLRNKFSVDQRPCVLFVSSISGNFPFIKKVLSKLSNKYNFFVIYGRNKRLKTYLEKLDNPSVRMFSFYEDIWELTHLSSVIITKPGGTTVFEGVCKKKTFVFTHFIPGQEEGNMEIAINCGVGKRTKSALELIEAIEYFVEKGSDLAKHYPLNLCDIRPKLKCKIDELINENT
ncbi:MAG: hypothetical protein GY858_07860 [Candidatus Omnitrophica bacterium]|nr:hypothetical protein [Candidatus Omnitrophota bacterium]